MEKEQNRPHFVRAGAYVAGGRFIGIGAAFAVNLLLARELSQEHFGAFLFVRSAGTFAGVIAMTGMDVNLVRLAGEAVGRNNLPFALRVIPVGMRLLCWSTGIIALLSTLILIFGGWDFLKTEISPTILLFASIVASVAALPFRQVSSDILRVFNEWRFSSLLSGVTDSPLGSVAFFATVLGSSFFVDVSLNLVFALNGIIAALSAVLGLFALRWHLRAQKLDTRQSDQFLGAVPSCWQLMSSSASATLIQAQAFAFANVDLWIAGIFVSLKEMAIYGSAKRLAGLIGIPYELMMRTVTPTLPVLLAQSKTKEIEKLLRTLTRYAVSITAIPVVAMLVVPDLIMVTTFGERFQEGGTLLALIACTQLIFVWYGAAGTTLMMAGKQREVLVVNSLAQIALIAGGLTATWIGGTVALAIWTMFTIAIQRLAFLIMAKRLLGIDCSPKFHAAYFKRSLRVR